MLLRYRLPFLCIALSLAIASHAPAGQVADPWEPLHLISVPSDHAMVRIDPALADQRKAIVASVEASIAQNQAIRRQVESDLALLPKAQARTYQLVGLEPSEAFAAGLLRASQRVVAGFNIELAEPQRLQVVVLLGSTAKAYLRDGGTLPNFSYDAVEDAVTYEWAIDFSSQTPELDAQARHVQDLVVLPLKSPKDINNLSELWLINWTGPQGLAIAIHETAEAAALARMHFHGPHFRWFSDGLANVMAVRVLRDLGQPEGADQYDKLLRSGKREHLRRASNLRYWLGLNYEPALPFDDENELKHARYEFAYELVKGLADRHGVDVLKQIIDKIGQIKQPTGTDLVRVAGEVTGEDVAALLAAFQPPGTFDDQIAEQSRRYVLAEKAGNHEAMITALKRLMELRWAENGFSYAPELYIAMAADLRSAGYAEAGVQVLRNDVKHVSCHVPKVHNLMLKVLINYAIENDHPDWAWDAADQLLKMEPNHAGALIVHLHHMAAGSDAGSPVDAANKARQLLTIAAEQHVELSPEQKKLLQQIIQSVPPAKPAE